MKNLAEWEKCLSDITGKKIIEIIGYVSMEFGDPVFKIYRIVYEDETFSFVEGEHDFPYIPTDKNVTEETLEKIREEEDEL